MMSSETIDDPRKPVVTITAQILQGECADPSGVKLMLVIEVWFTQM